MKINVGSGTKRMDGYINIDIRDLPEVDYVHDLEKPLPYPDNTIDEVYAEDVLEHFSFKKTNNIFKDWVRVLKTGGVITIIVPNVDAHIRMYYNKEIIEKSLQQANCFKLNEDEFPIVADMFGLNGSEEDILDKFLMKFDLQVIALTKGAEGSILYTGEDSSFVKSATVEVIDTVGAGDSFTAAIAVGLLRNLPLKTIHEQATNLSAFVCTQNGAMPAISASVIDRFR